jgi:hypothetical protein
MKKIILLLLIVGITPVMGQNLFMIGEKSYPATEIIELGGKLKIVFSKQLTKNVIILKTHAYNNCSVIRGKAIIYLDNGGVITLLDNGIYDLVNKESIIVYYLTADEIEKLKASNINTIRYAVKNINDCKGGDNGDYTASNDVGYGSIGGKRQNEKIDFKLIISKFFK